MTVAVQGGKDQSGRLSINWWAVFCQQGVHSLTFPRNLQHSKSTVSPLENFKNQLCRNCHQKNCQDAAVIKDATHRW